MSVNPNLETLMSLVEDLQDQMPEGKYLEAMNALRDLHRNTPARPAPAGPRQTPAGYVRLTAEEWRRYETMQIARNQRGSQKPEVQKVYEDTKYLRDVCDAHNVTMLDWIAMDYEERIDIIHETLLKMTNERMFEFLPNPPASECPFISRHSVGRWGKPSDPKATWSCVCGSSHILSKNWEKHEESDKHKAWAGGRRVTKNLKKTMTENLCPEGRKKELLGWEIHYNRWHYADQDANEWTNPEMFAQNIPPPNPQTKWVAGNWAYAIKNPLKAPKIKCAHDPLLPENQARYGRAQILAPLPRLPHQQQFWGQQAGGYLAYSHEMMQADYDAWIAMAE